jgi:hypothetical protein
MFSSARTRSLKSVLSVFAFAASLAFFACTSTSSEEEEVIGGGSAEMTYDGKSWEQATGICPGNTDYVSTFTLTSGDESRVLYIQGKSAPVAGTYPVSRGVDHPDSIATGQVAVSIYNTDFSSVNATGGTVTISKPSSSTVRFEGASVTFDNGKTAVFTVTATFGCTI